MGIATDDIHAHLTTAEAKEEESAGNTVDNDIERVGNRHGTTDEGVGDGAGDGEPGIGPCE